MIKRLSSTAALALLAACVVSSVVRADERDQEIERLKEMVHALQQRVEALEAEAGSQTPDVQVIESAPPATTDSAASPADPPQPATDLAAGYSQSGAEAVEDTIALPPAEGQAEGIDFTGAVRYNFFLDEENADTTRGASGFDIFRIGAEGSLDNFLVSAEYRFYSYMNTLHHGWIGYDLEDGGQFQLGVSQVPFGILPYASHNYWFGVPYYLGLADDYDLGLKYVGENGDWDFHLAFYKNEELGDASNLDRIAYDLVTVGDQANEEANQFNARIAYTLGNGTDAVHELGFSGQWGQIFNTLTGENGDHWAAAVHLDSRYKRWNFQFELARYEFSPENPPGVSDDTVRLGAFAGFYDVSSAGTVGVANVAYNVPVRSAIIDQILVYNDFSIVHKDVDAFEDSMLNTTGAAVGMGPVFIYLDLIQGRNMVFFGNGSLAGGGNTSWERQLNVNVGYYW